MFSKYIPDFEIQRSYLENIWKLRNGHFGKNEMGIPERKKWAGAPENKFKIHYGTTHSEECGYFEKEK